MIQMKTNDPNNSTSMPNQDQNGVTVINSLCITTCDVNDRIDCGTMTDESSFNCSEQKISKLKEKAHRAFMQVIEIENLYKQELEQQKEYYEEKQKNQLKKFAYKEQMLQERCRELDQELQKIQEVYFKRKTVYEEIQNIDSPFTVENVQSILPALTHPDDSFQSFFTTMKSFIADPNLKETSNSLLLLVTNSLKDLESQINIHERRTSNLINDKIKGLFPQISQELLQIFDFISSLIENTVTLNQKFTQLSKGASELQARYNKMYSTCDGTQKQLKFLTEQVKKLSADNLEMKKKNITLQKNHRNLQTTSNELKKIINQNGLGLKYHKESQMALSTQQIRYSNEDYECSKNSIVTSSYNTRLRKKTELMNHIVHSEKPMTFSINFKKK